MYYCPPLIKLIETSPSVRVNGTLMRIIRKELFTDEEIEELREFENYRKSLGREPSIMNFLPDDIRPKGIPKL